MALRANSIKPISVFDHYLLYKVDKINVGFKILIASNIRVKKELYGWISIILSRLLINKEEESKTSPKFLLWSDIC